MDKTNAAVSIFNKRAKDYQDKFMSLDLYNDTFDFFCEKISKQNATILELACGPGNITHYLLKKRPDLRILATDLSENMLELAKENNPQAEFQIMDCRDISRLNKKYDGIVCGFALPYLSREEAIGLIKDASEKLNPAGIMYLSTMEGDYTNSGIQKSSDGKDEMFIHYHQADYLMEALKNNNFETIELQRKDFHQPDGSITTDLVLIALK